MYRFVGTLQKRKFSTAFNKNSVDSLSENVDTTGSPKPTKIPKPDCTANVPQTSKLHSIITSPSSWHSFVVKTKGYKDDEILCFGDSSAGQLGLGFSEKTGTSLRLLKLRKKFSVHVFFFLF